MHNYMSTNKRTLRTLDLLIKPSITIIAMVKEGYPWIRRGLIKYSKF